MGNGTRIEISSEHNGLHLDRNIPCCTRTTYMHMSANAQRVSDQGFRATDQNLRDVQTFRDPTTGRQVELSNQYGHAWLNGANEYVMSDDPSFNPNAQLSGSWNELQPVPP
jgi:hypothetical protein